MKKLKYLLFILPFFFGINVFAKEVDVTSNCYGTTGYGSMYSGDEVQYQTYSNYSFGTTYQYQLSSFETELRYSLSANTDYVITFNTNNSNDFRNNFKTYNVYDLNNNYNNLVTGFTFVSMKKVQISFKTTTATNKVKIQMGGSNVYDNITGETNWNIKNAILTVPDTAPSGSTNQDVINNATNNTNTIVNNQNQNTSDIINNNNQNTDRIVNQQEITNQCSKTNILDSSMCYNTSGSNDIECKVPLYANINYSFNVGTYNWSRVRLYDNSGSYLTTFGSGSTGLRQFNFTSVSNTAYGLFTFYPGNNVSVSNVDFSKIVLKCLTKQDDQTNAINDTNNYLKDDSDPNIADSEFTDLFNSVGFNDPLSYLLQLPVQFINQLVSQSNTCQTISLGTLWGVSLSLPCINIGSIIGQQVWDIIDVLFSVGLLVVIFKNLYQTFANLMTMGGEKEAREKFSMPTPMEFLSIILGGDR